MHAEDLLVAARGSPEWDAAWAGLASKIRVQGLGDGSDLAQFNDLYAEAWQYMGTIRGFHEFRHRAHPRTGNREYIRVAVA